MHTAQANVPCVQGGWGEGEGEEQSKGRILVFWPVNCPRSSEHLALELSLSLTSYTLKLLESVINKWENARDTSLGEK